MHKILHLSVVLIFLGTLLVPFSVSAFIETSSGLLGGEHSNLSGPSAAAGDSDAGIPFGGRDTVQHVCNSGLLVYIHSAVPPFPIIPVMWLWGELPYLAYTPPHPGQELLGEMGQTVVPCVLGIIPIGAGFPILFHGESLI